MPEANLTRFGPETFQLTRGQPVTRKASFRAVEGAAELHLVCEDVDRAWITVNGQQVAGPETFNGEAEISLPLNLEANNTIEVTVPGLPGGSLSVRVRQVTSADLRVQRQGYFGLNTTDMAKQRALYEAMGFIGEIYPAGPETSETFAQSLGFPEDYLIYVSLHSLENPPTMPFVDTVQFRGDSYREEPPYAQLNHLGMAYATYSTTDLDSAIAHLKAHGVEFLSDPATAPNGERFVFMQDQDGAFLKLIHTEDGDASKAAPHLVRLVNTNMNVSDLERSREFYRLIGFTESAPGAQAGGGEFAQAHGFDTTIEFDGQDISLGEGTDGATLQLRQWKTPYDDAAPYPPPVNHLGIDRINFYVENLTETIRTMKSLGFEPLGPVGGMPEIGIVFFLDPDGIKVQFAGPQNIET